MANMSLREHLFTPGPKRVLALDGGGIRGVVSLQILERVEAILRRRRGGDESFRLCDYFDLIGGTSTGAIIAAGLSIGMSVAEIAAFYDALGNSIFQHEWFRPGLLRPKYQKEPLEQALRRVFRDLTFGSEEIRTGLAVVLKRRDTKSPWVVHNNPRSKYFDVRPGQLGAANGKLLVREVVRASTAAPHYFDPELVQIATSSSGQPINGLFVDGGLSPHNNPALQLVMLAWIGGYGYRWDVGRDRLFVVSIGTGDSRAPLPIDDLEERSAAVQAIGSLSALMDDAANLNETILQWMSASPTARVINREVWDLSGDILGSREPLLSYVRYNAWLDADWLSERQLKFTSAELENIRAMDNPKHISQLMDIGRAAASAVVEEHFPHAFDSSGHTAAGSHSGP